MFELHNLLPQEILLDRMLVALPLHLLNLVQGLTEPRLVLPELSFPLESAFEGALAVLKKPPIAHVVVPVVNHAF